MDCSAEQFISKCASRTNKTDDVRIMRFLSFVLLQTQQCLNFRYTYEHAFALHSMSEPRCINFTDPG